MRDSRGRECRGYPCDTGRVLSREVCTPVERSVYTQAVSDLKCEATDDVGGDSAEDREAFQAGRCCHFVYLQVFGSHPIKAPMSTPTKKLRHRVFSL
jgi:hypothetical protein